MGGKPNTHGFIGFVGSTGLALVAGWKSRRQSRSTSISPGGAGLGSQKSSSSSSSSLLTFVFVKGGTRT